MFWIPKNLAAIGIYHHNEDDTHSAPGKLHQLSDETGRPYTSPKTKTELHISVRAQLCQCSISEEKPTSQ